MPNMTSFITISLQVENECGGTALRSIARHRYYQLGKNPLVSIG
ncbi:hypothetical protein VSAK1_19849 [Vibrio mediterranei AK1]|nr:hypothetical protein VSAK1_19849 [Vibrio mediterranei AK1]